ncbi:hypothetical protein [Castellaniella sp. MT123]|uniref:hypothetical protein n=1 Tax=Castellaniella sp. MT123 TaxID=3140381 RepID=UPI0031F34313
MDSTRITLVSDRSISDRSNTGKGHHRLTRLALMAALAAIPGLTLPVIANADVRIGVGIGIAPPALPVYAQPVAPGPGYIWTPGYWAWGPNGYYWVNGTWLMPPTVGMLWTPGWWGWEDGLYYWHAGYWGPRVGFYGGINYGFGYFGIGYVGGYWHDRHFYYNRAVNNINVTNIHNVYVDKTVIDNVHTNRASYNGGRGGIESRPTPEQRNYASQRHQTLPPMDRGPRQGMTPTEGRAPLDRPPQGRMQQDRPQQERMPQERMQQDRGPRPGFAPQPRAPEPQSRAPEPPRGQFRERDVRPAQRQDRQPEVRQQEYRPRGEAPAREERSGDSRPEHRGEGRFR